MHASEARQCHEHVPPIIGDVWPGRIVQPLAWSALPQVASQPGDQRLVIGFAVTDWARRPIMAGAG